MLLEDVASEMGETSTWAPARAFSGTLLPNCLPGCDVPVSEVYLARLEADGEGDFVWAAGWC